MEILRRIFWSTLLIETSACPCFTSFPLKKTNIPLFRELGYHMDMPESNIWKFDDRILLPGIHDSWEPFHENQRYIFQQSEPIGLSALSSNDTKAYFLAAISMCRMMRRCFASVVLFNHKEVYAPIIANELGNQLEKWHEHLPSSLKFDRQRRFSVPTDPTTPFSATGGSSSQAAVTRFLEMQFYQCLISTFWPAVYSILYLDTAPETTLADCSRFFDAYVCLVSSISTTIESCPHTPWNFYAR